jgi:hypothetical protein
MNWGEISNDQLDEAFAHFFGLSSAGLASVCELIREVDDRQSWMSDGARSLTDWVSARLNIRHETAGELVRVARRLVDLPVLSARFAAGDLSLDQVDAISRMATPSSEEGLIKEALGLSNAQLDRAARRADPPSGEDERKAHAERGLWIQRRLDGASGRLTTDLPNAELNVVESSIRERADRMAPNPETGLFDPYSQRMADGLVEVCATTGDQTTPPQVTVYTDLAALTTESEGVTELDSGNLIPNHTARRLSCDCVLETVITDGSVVVGVGRNSRTVPGWLRRLVYHRDGARCRFPGCRNTRWLQVHHIHHWAQGGTTVLDNLILLCGFHHRFLHEQGWHVTVSAHGDFQFRKPDWTLYPKPKPELALRLAALVDDRPT